MFALPGILEQKSDNSLTSLENKAVNGNAFAFWRDLQSTDIISGYSFVVDSEDNPRQSITRQGLNGTNITGRTNLSIIESSTVTNILDNNSEWTIEFLAFYKSSTDDSFFINTGDGSSDPQPRLQNFLTEFLERGIGSGNATYNFSSTVDNQWIHGVFLYDPSNNRRQIYVNDSLTSNADYNNRTFQGIVFNLQNIEVYSIALYDIILTPSQITDHFQTIGLSNPFTP